MYVEKIVLRTSYAKLSRKENEQRFSVFTPTLSVLCTKYSPSLRMRSLEMFDGGSDFRGSFSRWVKFVYYRVLYFTMCMAIFKIFGMYRCSHRSQVVGQFLPDDFILIMLSIFLIMMIPFIK